MWIQQTEHPIEIMLMAIRMVTIMIMTAILNDGDGKGDDNAFYECL